MLLDVDDAPDTAAPTFWPSCMSCPARCWLLHGERQNIDTFDNDTVEVEQNLGIMLVSLADFSKVVCEVKHPLEADDETLAFVASLLRSLFPRA